MEWIYLSVIHSIIVAGLILFLRYDDTPSNVFPIITNIIVGILSILYIISFICDFKSLSSESFPIIK